MSQLFLFPVIAFCNVEIVHEIQNVLTRQLFLTAIIDAATFDANVAANPNYPLEIHENNQRILVLRESYDLTNRIYADIVLFCKNGLIMVLENHYKHHHKIFPIIDDFRHDGYFRDDCCRGPGLTLPIDKVYLRALLNDCNFPCASNWWCRPNLYDLFRGHPCEAYDRDYSPFKKDPPCDIEPPGEKTCDRPVYKECCCCKIPCCCGSGPFGG